MTSGNQKPLWDNAQFARMYKTSEKFTGRWASELLERARFKGDLAKLDKLVVLDNACGTGILSEKIMEVAGDNAIKVDLTCADFAPAMLEYVKQRIETNSWPNARTFQTDAQDTKLPSSHFSHIFFSFGPMLIPNPLSSIKECYRMLAPRGLLGINTWELIGWYQDFTDAFAANPDLPPFPSHETFIQGFAKTKERWDKPQFVREHLEGEGFQDVQVEAVPARIRIDTTDELLAITPSVMNLIYTNYWTDEQKATLKPQAVEAVSKYIREKYGEGPIDWDFIGICAWARKPE